MTRREHDKVEIRDIEVAGACTETGSEGQTAVGQVVVSQYQFVMSEIRSGDSDCIEGHEGRRILGIIHCAHIQRSGRSLRRAIGTCLKADLKILEASLQCRYYNPTVAVRTGSVEIDSMVRLAFLRHFIQLGIGRSSEYPTARIRRTIGVTQEVLRIGQRHTRGFRALRTERCILHGYVRAVSDAAYTLRIGIVIGSRLQPCQNHTVGGKDD